jgi:hypothetical protein
MHVWVSNHKEIIMATVNKDFKVKHGLIVEGENATVDGSDIITADSITAGNGEGGNENVTVSYDAETKKVTFAAAPGYSDEDVKDVLTGSTQTNISITEVEGVLTITAENGVEDSTTDDLDEGTTNKYFTDQRALDATASAYDVAGAAASAQTAAESYADGLAVNYDAAGSASTAETNAKSYTDDLIGDATVDGTSGNTVTDRIATAVADLVDSAPEALDTLNELAAALGDDENFATTITTSIGTKQDALTAGSNIDITEATISVTGLTTDDVSEEESATNLYFTDTRAVDALEAVVPNFTAVEVNSVAKQVAATVSAPTAVQTVAYAFAKATYRSAKFLVKVAYSTHTEVSEVLLTLDTSDNIAITEFAIVSTNGSASAISAGINSANVELLVTPTNASSTITVVGTLLA